MCVNSSNGLLGYYDLPEMNIKIAHFCCVKTFKNCRLVSQRVYQQFDQEGIWQFFFGRHLKAFACVSKEFSWKEHVFRIFRCNSLFKSIIADRDNPRRECFGATLFANQMVVQVRKHEKEYFRVYNLQTGQPDSVCLVSQWNELVQKPCGDHCSVVYFRLRIFCFLPKGFCLVKSGEKGVSTVISASFDEGRWRVQEEKENFFISAMAANLEWHVFGLSDGVIDVVSINSQKPFTAFCFEAHTATISCLCLVENLLISGSEDCRVCVWNLLSEEDLQASFVGQHKSRITCVTKIGPYILAGEKDQYLKVWDLTTQSCIHTYELDGIPWFVVDWGKNTIAVAYLPCGTQEDWYLSCFTLPQ